MKFFEFITSVLMLCVSAICIPFALAFSAAKAYAKKLNWVVLIGIAVSVFYLRKNIIRIREKNKNEPKAYKRASNYILTGLWYGYLLVFFVGLTVNNLGNW